jgi:nucleoside-diphosphate-sugar epimerase
MATQAAASKQLHVIIGNGVIGQAVIAELKRRHLAYKIIGRSPSQLPEYFQADVADSAVLIDATKDATHIYLCIGLPYNLKVWQELWPVMMANTIAAAKANNAKLIFMDNVYMYGPAPLEVPITENHPQNPPSKKGIVRKAIADTLLQAASRGELQAVIGRSADFYGPGAVNSLLYIQTLQNMLKGKKAVFIGNPRTKHSNTYSLDAGRALVELALDDEANGQVWHLPTALPALTYENMLDAMAQMTNAPRGVTVMPRPVLALLKLFIPILREVPEMTYQTKSDYIFSSEKFMAHYPDFAITPYADGLKAMVASFSNNSN